MNPVTLLFALCLAACDMQAAASVMPCRRAAGPEPRHVINVFDGAALRAANQDPAQQAWNARVNQCIREARR